MTRKPAELLPLRLRGHSHAASVFVALSAAGTVFGAVAVVQAWSAGVGVGLLWFLAAAPCALLARAIAIGRIRSSVGLDRAALVALFVLAATTDWQLLRSNQLAAPLTARSCLVVVISGLVLRSRGVLVGAWVGAFVPWAAVVLVAHPPQFALAPWLSTWVLALCLSAAAYLISATERHVHHGVLGDVQSAAHRDALTGLVNRGGFHEQAPTVLRLARQRGCGIWCAFVDVDGFKRVNDVLGHDVGDEVLVAVARAIERTGRDGDLRSRWGGDEFLVLGLGTGPNEFDFETRLRDRLLRLRPEILAQWAATVTVGMAAIAGGAELDLGALITEADQAMYDRRRLAGRVHR